VVIGEGSSGGALGIGVADHLAMLQYATYFVISPEGCANIIWKSSDYAADAAAAMGVTSEKLQELGIVDATINEPLGGAHRDPEAMAQRIRDHLIEQLAKLRAMSLDDMLDARYARLLAYGN
jgi:acetyl-CoA carboxylase carboxyl transferase subunit alpha